MRVTVWDGGRHGGGSIWSRPCPALRIVGSCYSNAYTLPSYDPATVKNFSINSFLQQNLKALTAPISIYFISDK